MYNLLYKIAQNTAGTPPEAGDNIYTLASKVAQNTAGTPPVVGDSMYNLLYKIAGNTAGTLPKFGDGEYDLLYKITANTEGSYIPRVGDGKYNLLSKISGNTGVQPASSLIDSVAYWKLNEVSGTRTDSVGTTALTDNNTVTSAAGKIGTAAFFTSANSEYLSCANNPVVTTGGDFTFVCWTKATILAADYPVLASKGWDGGSANREWVIYLEPPGRLQFSVVNDGGPTGIRADTAGVLITGTWYFIAVWYDSANALIGIQVNNLTPDTTACTYGVRKGSNPFWIGGSPLQSAYWNGLVDEAGLWKRALTPEERAQLYNGGAGITYPFSS